MQHANERRGGRGWLAAALTALIATACDGGPVETLVEVPPRPAFREWIKVEPPGAVCSNGSQFKFFVNFSDVSNDLVVAFEPGGACWDYESCTGKNGIRGAANIDGLEDDHYVLSEVIVPFFQRQVPDNQTRDWNFVYVPYCTGDVHTGNSLTTYTDPDGVDPDVEFHHDGHANSSAIIDWIASEFPEIPKLLLTGCSAGGAGSLVNYYYFRTGLPQAREAFLLDDSGPIFPSSGFSGPMHAEVRAAWNVDSLLAEFPGEFDPTDFGGINRFLAEQFPEDRLAITYFRRDFNYSLYSYERFYELSEAAEVRKEQILEMWDADTALLTEQLDQFENMAYYIPYWRNVNDSHCTTLFSFAGSDIEEAGVGLGDFVTALLDPDAPLESYLESVQPGEDP